MEESKSLPVSREHDKGRKQIVDKLTHTIVLDSSPLLLNTPSLSTLLAKSSALFTTPSVISEIRDQEARLRIETLYLPFITLSTPKPESVRFVKEFARKTGDAAVLSAVDVEVLALAYDLECDRNNGDWRLRKAPGQKRVNGSPTRKTQPLEEGDSHRTNGRLGETEKTGPEEVRTLCAEDLLAADASLENMRLESTAAGASNVMQHIGNRIDSTPIQTGAANGEAISASEDITSSDEDSEGWITPSNIKKHQTKDETGSSSTKSDIKMLQVATITGDFAMQNVLLQMNLNLLSSATCKRVSNIKQTIFRCHGCFATTKDMSKQFCPRCGNPTLTRVSCTTNDKGEVKLHLKANMQWNNKGNVFSIPKPSSSSSNQKWKGPRQGGGQSGWGNELVLAEDQKEYIRAMSNHQRSVKKDLMDEDCLPSILTGDRDRGGGRIRVGGGRNINARKR